jgi:hypothetical protein
MGGASAGGGVWGGRGWRDMVRWVVPVLGGGELVVREGDLVVGWCPVLGVVFGATWGESGMSGGGVVRRW